MLTNEQAAKVLWALYQGITYNGSAFDVGNPAMYIARALCDVATREQCERWAFEQDRWPDSYEGFADALGVL